MTKKLFNWRTVIYKACFAILMFSITSSGLKAQVVTAIGANNGYNGPIDYPCPLQDFYFAQRAQYLYTEAELNAAGIMPGSTINSIGWDVMATFNSSSNTQPILLENYTIALDTTLVGSLGSVWENGPMIFYGPTTYNYALLNTMGPGGYIMYPGTYVYNGGNLLVEVCSGVPTGDYSINPSCGWTTGLGFNGSHTWRDDNATGCGNVDTTNDGMRTTRPRLVVDFTPSIICAGAPTAGIINGPDSACINQQLTLSLSGATVAAGISYQWEESPVGTNTWAPINNATAAVYQTTMAAAMDYRCMLSCGTFTVNTPTATVTESPFYACYCSPLTGTTLVSNYPDNHIMSVEIPTTSLNNPTTYNGGYSQFSPNIPNNTATLYPGLSYTINVGTLYSGLDYAVWIDYDGDGVMDNTTEIIALAGSGSLATGSFTVPATAVAGMIGLRVRINGNNFNYGGTNQGPCDDDVSGETEDYVVTVGTLNNCVGQPSHATASAPSNVCPGIDFNLSATGASVGTGVSYDWQSDDGTGWLPTGQTNMLCAISGGITNPTSYRLVTNCSFSNLFDTSNILTIGINPFYYCYCSPLTANPLASNGANNYITGVEIPTTSLNNPTTTYNPNGYSQFNPSISSNSATLYPGVSYTINVGGLYPYVLNYAGAWIDYNADGAMDTTEFITLNNNYAGYATGSFTVPSTAVSGMTGLRVRMNGNNNVYGGTNQGACDDDFYGESEDYVITIGTLTNCAGQPSHATASGPSDVCSSVDFNLSATGMAVGVGVTYDWQADDGSGWMSTGGSTTIYTVSGGTTVPISYRLVTNCALSNMFDTSNVISMIINPFYNCYCSPLIGSPLSSSYQGNFVTGVSIHGTSLNNPTSTSSASGYSQFSPPTTSTTTDLYQGVSYTINVDMLYPQYDDAGAWIDFDANGVFDNNTEFVAMTNNGYSGASGTFVMPLSATLGLVGFRVRVNDYGNTYGGVNQGPCDDDFYGETEDYVIGVLPTPNCLPPAGLSEANITATAADVSWSSSSTLHQIEYAQGANFTLGTGSRVTTGVNPYTVSGLMPSTQYSYYVRAVCGPNDTSMWTMGNAFYTRCTPISSFQSVYDVETQPVNTGNGPMADCWTASPIPSIASYSWWVSGTGTTGTSNTGPSSANSGSHYFFTEASWGIPNSVATLTSPSYNISTLTTPELNFYYHMFGATIAKLVVEIHDGTGWHRVDSIVGQQQGAETDPWLLKSISLNGFTGVIEIRFEGTKGTNALGDMAIDDITIGEPLAIKLGKLSAVNLGASNRIDWNTMSEDRTDRFELQRSPDGKNYNTITSKNAMGEASRYTYMDNEPFQGINYYRLRMIEINGKVAYSDVVSASVRSANAFAVYAFPNPVSNNLTVKVSGKQGNGAFIQITDIAGKVIKTVLMNGPEENIDMSGLAGGIYLVKYADINHTKTIRVNKY